MTILMYDKRITCKELAEATGVSLGMIDFVKLGEKIPSVALLNGIAKYLGVTMDELVNGDCAAKMYADETCEEEKK